MAPIIRPGERGSGLGMGAECVGWKRRRVEENRRRRKPLERKYKSKF